MTFQTQSALVDRTSNARGTSTSRALSGSVAVHLFIFAALAFALREAVVSYQSPHQLELEFVKQTEQIRKTMDERQIAAVPNDASVAVPSNQTGARTRVAGESDNAKKRPVAKQEVESPYPLPVPNTQPAKIETGLPKAPMASSTPTSGLTPAGTRSERIALTPAGTTSERSRLSPAGTVSEKSGLSPAATRSETSGLSPAATIATTGAGTPYVGSPAPAPLDGSSTIPRAESTAGVRQDQFVHGLPNASPPNAIAAYSPLLVSRVAGFARRPTPTNDDFFAKGLDGTGLFKIVWPRDGCQFDIKDGFNALYTAPVLPSTYHSTLYLVNENGERKELGRFREMSGVARPGYIGTKTNILAKSQTHDTSPIGPGRYKLLLISQKEIGGRGGVIIGKSDDVRPEMLSNDPRNMLSAESDGWFTLTNSETTTPLQADLVNRFFAACPIHVEYKTGPNGEQAGCTFSLSNHSALRSGGGAFISGD